MISEDRKYKSEFYKIAGLALMTPLCRFALSVIERGFENLTFNSLGHFLASIVLFTFGIMAIQVGYQKLLEE